MKTKKVFKYELETNDFQEFKMPKDSEILSIQTQKNTPCIWALVDPEEKLEQRFFRIYGTGHDINYDMGISMKYIGTYQLFDGSLIFHVFEVLQ